MTLHCSTNSFRELAHFNLRWNEQLQVEVKEYQAEVPSPFYSEAPTLSSWSFLVRIDAQVPTDHVKLEHLLGVGSWLEFAPSEGLS